MSHSRLKTVHGAQQGLPTLLGEGSSEPSTSYPGGTFNKMSSSTLLPSFLGHSFKDQTISATKRFLRLPLSHLLQVYLTPTPFVPEKAISQI